MNFDELEQRLRRIDPAEGLSVDPVTGPRAAALMEQIMHTIPDAGSPAPMPSAPSGAPLRGRRRLVAAIGAGVAAVAVAGALAVAALSGGDKAHTSVSYSLAAPNPAQMCINIEGIESDPSWIGFRGTVVEVGEGTVTLEVAKWYRGGDADRVVLTVPAGGAALEGGTDFTVGGDFLVGVMDGTTLGCGISGPYSADLDALYQKWFG